MKAELQRAYDALQQADAAGNEEDAQQIADYIRELEAQEKQGAVGDMMAPVGGLAIGATTGAITGPYVGKGIDTAATKIAEKVAGPKGTPRGDKVAKWLATQTTGPNVGGATFEEAYKKSEIARGKPVQSRGSQIPIRKGFLGVQNQPAEPSLPQKAAANIMSKEKLGVPGVPRRIGGMGVAGAETGKMISDLKQGNYFDALLSGVGAVGGAMSQSRIPPIRAIGTGLSTVVPSIQGYRAAKETFYPSVLEEKGEEEEKPEMAKGGLIALAKGGSTAAWQRSEGKNPEGGLNAAGRASYKRETGGELKPPVSAKEAKKSPKKASRRKSFCARMGGMKKKLTSSKTANDPDSRINKALRKWDC